MCKDKKTQDYKAFRLQRSSQTRLAMLMCLATSCAACAISVCYSVCFSENCALGTAEATRRQSPCVCAQVHE